MNNSMMAIDGNYNQNRWNGFLNFSLITSAPVFNSKLHFLNVDQAAIEQIKVYKRSVAEENLIKANPDEDDISLYVEPYTGLTLSAWLKIQGNVELSKNLLFNTDVYGMLPFFSIVRGGDIPNETVSYISFFFSSSKIKIMSFIYMFNLIDR